MGRAVVPGFAAYSASKFALEAVADAYRYELSPFGIDSVWLNRAFTERPSWKGFFHLLTRIAWPSTALRPNMSRQSEACSSPRTAAETPGPEEVVEAFVRLIETPAGERPFWTVPTAAIQPLLEPYNGPAATMRDTVAQIFKVPELTVLQRAASAGA
jgi:NAD(P)-dependent dehydrogenase (short-subunit alcohol dehydrogenase family)